MSSIPFLKLPFLAQEVVLLYLDLSDITDFSLCSKRSQRVVQRIRHPYTGININLNKFHKLIKFMCGNVEKGSWAIDWKWDARFPKQEHYRTIDGRMIQMLKGFLIFHTYSTANPALDFKKILDHSRETFNLKVIRVELRPDDIKFRRFVSYIGECQDFYCYNKQPMRRDDHQYILDKVKISGNFKSPFNFID